ncbi:MAG TPA: rubredoxin, partial [Hyphomicrobiaceae bacterium]|nr:rubredoxin [Hyphomicrobiaceae bacterium]
LECKICWYIYVPAEGDYYWQIPPGTPFIELPERWSCPNCDAGKSSFMVIGET